ncbi:MAG: hypothetical protein M1276_07845 [Deltaproteobacteria bacterium]|jgi:hypothetical protein|nr:hypothetical protein [Deltaproteobacteria bacterium]
MKLALLITTDKYKNHVENILSSAERLGYGIKCFMMDDGVNLLNDADYIYKLKEANAHVSLCEYSCSIRNINDKVEGFEYASQYENATIMNELKAEDRLLVF